MVTRRSSPFHFAIDSAFAGIHTAVTLWHRLPMLAFASLSPSAKTRKEATRMISEKAAALVEGSVAAGAEVMKAATRAATGRLSSKEAGAAAVAVTAAAMKPAFRRVRGNAHRLSRRPSK
jgi:hypothetical protein